jgi:hypothetical protein
MATHVLLGERQKAMGISGWPAVAADSLFFLASRSIAAAFSRLEVRTSGWWSSDLERARAACLSSSSPLLTFSWPAAVS